MAKKRKSRSTKGWALSKYEHALAQLGRSRSEKYSTYLKKERKRGKK